MDAETTAARKQELRRTLRARRTETYSGQAGARRRTEEAERILAHASPLVVAVERAVAHAAAQDAAPPLVAAFHPTPTEADVMPLARRLAGAGARLVFPAAASGEELEWVAWDGSSEFLPSPGKGFGREPQGERLGTGALAEAMLVLTPAVAVDRSRTRIGHGAGYYDRALTTIPRSAMVVAVIHPDELLEKGALVRGGHDVPIPAVLTADGLVSLVTSAGF